MLFLKNVCVNDVLYDRLKQKKKLNLFLVLLWFDNISRIIT